MSRQEYVLARVRAGIVDYYQPRFTVPFVSNVTDAIRFGSVDAAYQTALRDRRCFCKGLMARATEPVDGSET